MDEEYFVLYPDGTIGISETIRSIDKLRTVRVHLKDLVGCLTDSFCVAPEPSDLPELRSLKDKFLFYADVIDKTHNKLKAILSGK